MVVTEALCLGCVQRDDQYQMLVQDYEIVDRERRRALRKVAELERELNGSASKESEEVRAVLNEWDRLRRRLFRGCRDVTLDMKGDRAKAVRSAKRRGHLHEDLMLVPLGASLSEWHSTNRDYFEITSLLAKDKRVETHVQRARDYRRLLDAGFDEEFARGQLKGRLRVLETMPFGVVLCPACDCDPCRCGVTA